MATFTNTSKNTMATFTNFSKSFARYMVFLLENQTDSFLLQNGDFFLLEGSQATDDVSIQWSNQTKN